MKKFLALVLISAALYSCSSGSDDQKKKDEAAAAATTEPAKPATTPPAEIGDPKYIDMGKASVMALHNHDVNGFTKDFADNVVFIWNNLDSVVGKPAVVKFWNDRFATALDSVSFSNQIWLPVKVNQPQSIEAPGTWLMSWYLVSAKYKTGKSMHQWMHNTMHIGAGDKIDRVLQFRDNALIMAAMKK